jgi:hypothetical protein
VESSASQIVKSPVAFLIALLAILLFEVPLSAILRRINTSAELPAPRGVRDRVWRDLISSPGQAGAAWLGRIERLLFFGSLVLGTPELIVAWLVFKVGSKWQVWQHVIRAPDRLGRAKADDYFVSRNAWGALVFTRFLVGTGANILAAILGLALFQLLASLWSK